LTWPISLFLSDCSIYNEAGSRWVILSCSFDELPFS